MNFPPLVPAVFIKRHNRFTAGVRLDSAGLTTAFIPTTGRLTGALRPGCRAWLQAANDPKRKTPFTLVLTELEHGGLCSVNAMMANRLFDEAVQRGSLAAFTYATIENEVPFGHSRLDFRLSVGEEVCWVEVKSVTYAADGVGKFPDAPTARGRKHLEELAALAANGYRASVVFVAQRKDALSFEPYEAIDPAFAEVLGKVNRLGVEVHAYRCIVDIEGVEIAEEVPVSV